MVAQENETKAPPALPQKDKTEAPAAASKPSTVVEPVATQAAASYRTDLGESLPPQNPAGVE